MKASTETTFYLLELLKVLAPVIGIAFILVAIVHRYRAVRSRALVCLTAVTALWLLVALAGRLALSAPARTHFISAAMRDYATSQQETSYFTLTEWLWTAEQIIVLVFGVLLFVAFRGQPRQTSNQSLQPTAGHSDV